MRIGKGWIVWVLLAWLGALAPSFGQSSPASGIYRENGEIPPPPTSGILDRTGLFTRNPALFSKIAGQIQQLKTDHGFQIYLVLESLLVSETVQRAAIRLQDGWLPEGNGMVMVFELDSRELGLGQPLGQSFGKKVIPGQIPSYESMTILTSVMEDLDRDASTEEFLEVVTSRMVAHYNAYFTKKEAPLPEGRTLRLNLILIGGAAALALIALGAGLVMRRSAGALGDGLFTLPEASAIERLGAPYGASVSSHRFGAGAKGPV